MNYQILNYAGIDYYFDSSIMISLQGDAGDAGRLLGQCDFAIDVKTGEFLKSKIKPKDIVKNYYEKKNVPVHRVLPIDDLGKFGLQDLRDLAPGRGFKIGDPLHQEYIIGDAQTVTCG